MTRIQPNRIISVTDTTRVSPWTLSMAARKRVAVWRAFKLVLAFTAALAALGCTSEPDYTHATVGTTGGADMTADVQRAIDAWNRAGNGSLGLTFTTDAHPDIIVQYGPVSKPTMCGETWNQTVTISPADVAPEVCTHYDPATIIAHELGHAISRRKHSPIANSLMNDYGTHAPVEEAIQPSDVSFMFGEGSEVP